MLLQKKEALRKKGGRRLFMKKRSESNELLRLRSLFSRSILTEKEKQYYLSLEKGYEGEVQFDERVSDFPESWLFVNDLLLEQSHSYFQIDSLGFVQEDLYLFDVKNFEGDFIVKGDSWKTTSGTEIKNPLHQLQRCESLLKRFLQDQGFYITIKPYLIFINPAFTLYQAPQNSSIIFPTQLHWFLGGLRKKMGSIGPRQIKTAEMLIAAHQDEYPNPLIPKYQYRELRKGIVCTGCKLFMHPSREQRRMVCVKCGHSEDLEYAVLRSVVEFQLLFPEERVSTSRIFDWCGGVWCKKTIQRVLTKYFTCIHYGQSSYYVNSK